MTSTNDEIISLEGETPYAEVLEKAQRYISNRYAAELAAADDSDASTRLPEYLRRYLIENNVLVALPGITLPQLVERLYFDMSRFGFLTPYLTRTDIEEININGWNCVKIVYRDGSKETIHDGFPSRDQALSILRRLLRASGGGMDESHPQGNADLNSRIRIIANQYPVIRPEDGISASVRFIPQAMMSRDVMEQTASPEMLEFLETALLYRLNLIVAGETGSGKTNTLGYLVSTLPVDRRIVSIEEGSRELDFRRFDAKGNVTNDVVQFLTREHEDPQLCITQSDLLRTALRYDPDVIVMGEVRSRESFAVQEAARTHTVISTCHANDALGVYDRLVSMAKQMMDYSDEYLLKLMVAAFPVIVYQKRWEVDNSRRITEILEGESVENGTVKYRTLFSFEVDESDGGLVSGHFVRGEPLSERRIHLMRQNGLPKQKISILTGGG